MKLAYADPPYIGCAHLYRDHPDFAGEVDHAALIARLQSEFDGAWEKMCELLRDAAARIDELEGQIKELEANLTERELGDV